MGLYTLLAILFLFLMLRTIEHGPVEEPAPRSSRNAGHGV